jgi:hypothetical protein
MVLQFQILWTRDGMDLPEEPRFVVTMVQDAEVNTIHHVSLEITEVTPQDAGTYRVQATNELGQESVTVSLIVNSECH